MAKRPAKPKPESDGPDVSNPFTWVGSVTETKVDLIASGDAQERDYPAFMVNRALSYHSDTLMAAAQMDRLGVTLDRAMQYAYLLADVAKRRRFGKWAKRVKSDDEELVMRAYRINRTKAREALAILSREQLDAIRQKNNEGG